MIGRPLAAVGAILAMLLAGSTARAVRFDGEAAGAHSVPNARIAPAVQRAPSGDRAALAKQALAAGVKITWDSRRGTPICVRGSDLLRTQAFSSGKAIAVHAVGQVGQDAVAALDNLSPLYGIRDAAKEFTAARVESDSLGFRHVRLPQIHRGVRVVGGELLVHFDGAGRVYEVNGPYLAGLELDVAAQVTAGPSGGSRAAPNWWSAG